ncbi:hypothetical protein K2Z84_29100 [Candidatus Binatia bacterium]|nr:hypothetical protein [Candidatus Binatia bacterium]
MGLKVHSLARLPSDTDRDYFVYLLDYGWDEPLSRGLRGNFDRLADIASRHRAVVVTGFDGEEFTNEVFSWHQINGQPGEEILPAILVTTCHPHRFAEQNDFPRRSTRHKGGLFSDRMVLIPLRSVCRTETDVTAVIERIVTDIREKRQLPDFDVHHVLAKGERGALTDALILQPNLAGVGVDLRALGKFLFSGLWKKAR